MKETEIAEVVVSWLECQHWDVYQEVQGRYGAEIIDLVAVRCNIVWAIEVKRSLSLAVLAQAYRHQVHRRSVAVPSAKNSKARDFAFRVAKDYGIGILTVMGTYVDEIVCAPLLRQYHHGAKRLQETLNPQMKTWAKAGNAEGKRWTPYAQTISVVRDYIKDHPSCTLKEIMDHVGKAHYSGEKSARSGIRTALSNWESGWCRIDSSGKQFRFFIRELEGPVNGAETSPQNQG